MSENRVTVRDSRTELTIVFPPFPPAGETVVASMLPPHDPAHARRVVESLSTVAAVVSEQGELPRRDVFAPQTRADLDIVAVGCWGGVVHVIEPALATDAIHDALEDEVRHQAKLHPQARLTGSVFLDMVADWSQYVLTAPGADVVTVEGWDGVEVDGDLATLLTAIGADLQAHLPEDVDLDDPDTLDDFALSDLATLVRGGLKLCYPHDQDLIVSVFQVRRPETIASEMTEVWIRD
ncbi:DUF6333 family protein [Micromonospora sp. NPDC023956]|uniref:DUF6333 family protein n=1 Tax=Micromonospora sp. NPDC023956 TaxID=3155722 RepID=UPI0033C1DCC7